MDKMYKLNYAQDLGSKQNEWKRDKDILEERQKIQYRASSHGSITENIPVMPCFQRSSLGTSRREHLKSRFLSHVLLSH